jgi:hypothetical protein
MSLPHSAAVPADPGFATALQTFVSSPVVWLVVVGVLVFVFVVGAITCFGWALDLARSVRDRVSSRASRRRHVAVPRHAERTGLLIRS